MESIDLIEKEILNFWNKNKIFEKSLKKTKGKESYVFYDGPPFATGTPHQGHVLGSVAKDLFARFWTMNNKHVLRIWGWDCHGLPIENIAEKELGINSKDEIEKIGVKKFNDYCRKKVLEYDKYWKKFIPRIGRWVDMENSYKTMDNDYIESVWWAFSELWKKDLIYQGEKILMYCPRCSTPLAKAEIAMDNSYKKIKEKSVILKFKLKNEDAFALAWTTTPWTLPSNLALAVNKKLDYVYVKDKTNGEIYLTGKDSLNNLFKKKEDYKIIKEIKGEKLEKKEYQPLFEYFKNNKNSFKIVLGDFVNSDEGTAIVHIAPAFGEDDYEISKKYKIPLVNPVDEKGIFTDEIKDFEGKFVHHSNNSIIEFLREKGKIVLVKEIEHEYPFCHRCDTKLIYRAIPSWFVNIQKIKPKILKLIKKTKWHPSFLRDGRLKHTIETAPDWNISRNRYWATPIPIWVSEDGEKLILGSIDDLKKYSKKLPGKINLHKDYLDSIILEKNGKKFKRVPEVMDCWFESGSMPFAQSHYPFENKEFFKKNFPAQFVAEYIGQVRTWFYYMIVLSAALFDDIPVENFVTTGNIAGSDGQKMSKSKNNFTDPEIIIKKYGADALRFYLMSSSVMNADDLNFLDSGVEEAYKKIILLFYNTNHFYEIYNQDKKGKPKKINSKNILDKWIIARLKETGSKITKYLKNYNTVKTCSEIREFIEDLSTWYLRRSRDRFNQEDKESHQTLGFVLSELSKICSPLIPFISEHIYRSINGKNESVHLQDWPKFKENKNKKIIEDMAKTREIVSIALRERGQLKIPIRQPLSKITIKGIVLDKDYLKIISDEINVKKIEIKKGKKLSVKFNTQITPELEAEGYARELSRQVQAFRKKIGLQKKDKIILNIITDENFRKMLERQKEFIKERTNSRDLEIVTTSQGVSKESFKNKIEFKIKDKRGKIVIVC